MCIDISSSDFIYIDSSTVGVPICPQLATVPSGRVVETMKIIFRQTLFWITLFGWCDYPPPLISLGNWDTAISQSYLDSHKQGSIAVSSLSIWVQQDLLSKGSMESYLKKCSQSTFPLGFDDPILPKTVGQLVVELFNGARVTIVKGDIRPLTGLIIPANFDLAERAN